jgi:hypothetical protein
MRTVELILRPEVADRLADAAVQICLEEYLVPPQLNRRPALSGPRQGVTE